MSSQLKESLSAAIDGEADQFELRRVLDEVGRDPQLRASWQRYHAIGALIRGDGRVRPPTAVSPLDRLRAGIDGSASATEALASSHRSRVGRLAGAGVAAMVALGIVIGFGDFSTAPLEDERAIAEASLPIMGIPASVRRAPDVIEAPDLSAPALAAADAARRTADLRPFPTESDMVRSQAYMLMHAHHMALSRPPGPTSLVKVAAFESR